MKNCVVPLTIVAIIILWCVITTTKLSSRSIERYLACDTTANGKVYGLVVCDTIYPNEQPVAVGTWGDNCQLTLQRIRTIHMEWERIK